jgi:hypothetical protein
MVEIGYEYHAGSSGFVVDKSSGRVHLIPCGLDNPGKVDSQLDRIMRGILGGLQSIVEITYVLKLEVSISDI